MTHPNPRIELAVQKILGLITAHNGQLTNKQIRQIIGDDILTQRAINRLQQRGKIRARRTLKPEYDGIIYCYILK